MKGTDVGSKKTGSMNLTGHVYNSSLLELKADVGRLFDEILFPARSHYEIWWIYINRDDRSEFSSVLVKHKDFFELLGYANLAAMIVALFKLYDKQQKSLSIPNLIERASRQRILNSEDISALSTQVSEARPLWEKIVVLRSNLIAHQNRFLTREEIYAIAQITPDQIKDLTERSLSLLNDLTKRIGAETRSFTGSVTKGAYDLLMELKSLMGKA